jgi:hypothetical protein
LSCVKNLAATSAQFPDPAHFVTSTRIFIAITFLPS